MAVEERDHNFGENKRIFDEFLNPDHGDSIYKQKIQEMVQSGSKRLVIDLNHINQYDPNLRMRILQSPMDLLPAWEEVLKSYIDHSDFAPKESMGETYKIAFEGGFGAHRTTPQQLLASSLGTMVCVEGIVTKVSLVRPKCVQTVHYCEATQNFSTNNYRDATALSGLPTGSGFPTTDPDGNPLTTEFGLCTYMDHQTVFIQDMPERTSAGSMPQTVECILDDDLVDACKPGDRVQMIGIYRALAGRAQGTSSGRFHTVILTNHVRKLGRDDHSRSLSINEIKEIRKLAKRKDLFDLLANSIAPSLYGHDYIKKAIILQLLGGLEKNLDNGTHIRGDINILMVGDPSCGKSQLLRAVLHVAPLAINTTGRGSSGVGLTAAVTQDRETGERRLEAGAMVLADRGTVCIDEFDKMSDADRTAIHEVMEQQTVTIAKAGIHTSLNARCSVIAAANPVYGMYDRKRKPHENIGLADSLLSRFDLLFIVLDKIDTEIDRAISDHVLAMHLCPYNPHQESMLYDFDMMENNEEEDATIFEKNIPNSKRIRGKKKQELLTLAFSKKYIEFAKKQFKPQLTDEACELIAQKYGDLRTAERNQTLPITARALETIIRLSTAHAKLRLSKKITESDVEEALVVLQYALTNNAEPESKQHEKYDDNIQNDDENVDDDNKDKNEDEDDEKSNQQSKKHKSPRKKKTLDESGHEDEPQDIELDNKQEDEKAEMETTTPRQQRLISRKRKEPDSRTGLTPAKSTKRFKPTMTSQHISVVTTTLAQTFKKLRVDVINVDKFYEELSASHSDISHQEYMDIINHLQEQNKIFYEGDNGNIHAM